MWGQYPSSCYVQWYQTWLFCIQDSRQFLRGLWCSRTRRRFWSSMSSTLFTKDGKLSTSNLFYVKESSYRWLSVMVTVHEFFDLAMRECGSTVHEWNLKIVMSISRYMKSEKCNHRSHKDLDFLEIHCGNQVECSALLSLIKGIWISRNNGLLIGEERRRANYQR